MRFCTVSNKTKDCTNLQLHQNATYVETNMPPLVTSTKSALEVNGTHLPTSHHFVLPNQSTKQTPITSNKQSITFEENLTLVPQNLLPFDRKKVLQLIQHATKETFKADFKATYSKPYVHFDTSTTHLILPKHLSSHTCHFPYIVYVSHLHTCTVLINVQRGLTCHQLHLE